MFIRMNEKFENEIKIKWHGKNEKRKKLTAIFSFVWHRSSTEFGWLHCEEINVISIWMRFLAFSKCFAHVRFFPALLLFCVCVCFYRLFFAYFRISFLLLFSFGRNFTVITVFPLNCCWRWMLLVHIKA